MVAYFKSVDGYDPFYHRYRHKRDVELFYNEEDEEENQEESEILSREKRAPKKKKRRKFSEIEQDFSYSNMDPYRDFYGGRYRYRHCMRRMFKVSFRDLGWQVKDTFKENTAIPTY